MEESSDDLMDISVATSPLLPRRSVEIIEDESYIAEPGSPELIDSSGSEDGDPAASDSLVVLRVQNAPVINVSTEDEEEQDDDEEEQDDDEAEVGGASAQPVHRQAGRPASPTAVVEEQEEGNRTTAEPAHPHNSSVVEFKSPRRLKVPTPKKSGNDGDAETDDEAECCPICFDAWTNSGNHRLASLKCGHLFGQSCIEKWLKGQGGKCPQCNTKAQRKDIRVIFAKTLRAIDTSERDRAYEELEKEKAARRKVELEAAQTRLRYQMALDECNKLRGDLDRQRHQLEMFRSQPGASSQSMAGPSEALASSQQAGSDTGLYIFEKTLKIWDAGCRVMAYNQEMATLCISQPSASPLFPGFGIKKLNCLDFRTSQYVAIHSKAIRDLAFNPGNPDGVLLSCAVDKTIKLTSLISNAVVQTYTCAQPVWSCVWSRDNRNCFYAGLQNGTVVMYDIRNTAECIQELNAIGSRSPCISLQYVPQNPNATFRPGGVLVGQLDRAVFYESQANSDHKPHMIPVDGNLTSNSLEESTRHFLTTYRPSARHPNVRHQMYELSSQNLSHDPTVVENMCSCNSIQTFHGGSTQKMLGRNRLMLSPHGNGGLLVCAGDEATSSVQVWDAGTGRLQQKFPTTQPVIDICPLVVNQQHYLVALTEKQISILHWRYTCAQPVWSCVWSRDNRNCFYAGLQNGTVVMYDIRNTAECIQELNAIGSRSPCISLQYVPQNPNATFRPGGVLVGQLDRAVFYESQANSDHKPHMIPVDGNLTSISLEESTRHFLTTYRPSARHPNVRHQMYELSSQNLSHDPTVVENMCSCNSIQTFHGGSTQKMLGRNRLMLSPHGNGGLLVCAGDEATSSVQVWDAGTGRLQQKFPTTQPVIDICPLVVNQQHYLVALTEKQISILHWR